MPMVRNSAIAAVLLLGWTLCAPAEEIPVSGGQAAAQDLPPVAQAYFAPANQVFYRLRHENGAYREFQRDLGGSPTMFGANGWRARISGSKITVRAPKDKSGADATYVFDGGRLVRYKSGETDVSVPRNVNRTPMEGVPPPFLFGTQSERSLGKLDKKGAPASLGEMFAGKWKKSGRLRYPFNNPNENGYLYASIAIFALLGLFMRPKCVKVAGVAVSVASSVLMLLTASRGSFLAYALGLGIVAAPNIRNVVRSKWMWIAAGVVALAAAFWFGTHESRLLTRGFKGASTWSNEIRLSMWKTAPRMMLDAPGGWEAYNIGRAYVDWYEDFDLLTAPGSLMNDHLTRLVRMDNFGRCSYVFLWVFAFAALAALGWRRRNCVPCASVAALAVASWFNPILPNRWLWIVPGLALAFAVLDVARDFRSFRWRGVAIASLFPLLAVGAFFGAVRFLGGRVPVSVPIRASGGAVCVNGTTADICILDDGHTLGDIFTCKEIRAAYIANPGLPPVLYARRIEDVPANVGRLVIGGEIADGWMRRVATDEKAREALPGEVVFVSPPFPPSAIPPPLHDVCRVKYVTGEFNAMFYPEFAEAPSWVEVVPGMELYVPDWIRYAFERIGVRR